MGSLRNLFKAKNNIEFGIFYLANIVIKAVSKFENIRDKNVLPD
jgi:hypothetical protein